jgi:hypothetical protein
VWGVIDHVKQKWKEKKYHRKAHEEWLEFAVSYAQWKSENRFSNESHHQWFIRQELDLFDKATFLGKKITLEQKRYRRILISQFSEVAPVRPPGIKFTYGKRR